VENIILFGLLLGLLFTYVLKILQDLISEIDLKPSLTQLLIIAIFTPILLINMQNISKNVDIKKKLDDDIHLINLKHKELKSKISDVNNTIQVLKIWKKNPSIRDSTVSKLNRKLDELNSIFVSYSDLYQKILFTDSSQFVAKSYMIDFESHQKILKSIVDITDLHKENITQFDIFRVEQFYETFSKRFNGDNPSRINQYYEFKKKLITQANIQILYMVIVNAFFIFLLFVLLLKLIYIEKIILNKLNKIKDKKNLNDDEKEIISNIQYFLKRRRINKFRLIFLDRKLNKLLDLNARNEGIQICERLLI